MIDTRARLAEAFHDHPDVQRMLASCRDVDELLDRSLAECARWLDCAGAGAEEGRGKLATFVRLARCARELSGSGNGFEGGQTTARDMAGPQAPDPAEAGIAGALLEPGPARNHVTVDAELLAEVFAALSRLCHKINNPLTSIMGRAQILQIQVPAAGDEKLRKSVQVIEESARRVAALVQELASLLCQGRKEFIERYDSRTGSR